MAEQRNQTPAGDNTQWTTIIRPRTGWFDVDLEELWRYRDLIVMFVKRNFTVMYKQTILGPLLDHPEPAYHHGAVQRGVRRHCRAFYGRYAELFVLHRQAIRCGPFLPPASTARPTPLWPTARCSARCISHGFHHPHQPGIDQPESTFLSSLSCTFCSGSTLP